MTVKELRKELKKFPSNMPIAIWNHDWNEYTAVECNIPFPVTAIRYIGKDENENNIYESYSAVSIG